MRTDSYPNPCGRPRITADGSPQHSVFAPSCAESILLRDRPLPNDSIETLQPIVCSGIRKAKLKRLALRPVSAMQNRDVLSAATTTSYSAFFPFARLLSPIFCGGNLSTSHLKFVVATCCIRQIKNTVNSTSRSILQHELVQVRSQNDSICLLFFASSPTWTLLKTHMITHLIVLTS